MTSFFAPFLNKTLFKVLLLKLLVVFVLLMTNGCGSSGNETVTPDPDNAMDSVIVRVEVFPDDRPIISMGQELQLSAKAYNADSTELTNATFTWSSGDESILTVSNDGLITGVSMGTISAMATAEGITGEREFLVVDLTGKWIGGEVPDTVSYTITQTGTNVEGIFQSRLGFPPITDVNTGVLTGSLEFTRYLHTLELTREDGCILQITGSHFVQVLEDGEIILKPSQGTLSSTNCQIQGTIDFAELRRE